MQPKIKIPSLPTKTLVVFGVAAVLAIGVGASAAKLTHFLADDKTKTNAPTPQEESKKNGDAPKAANPATQAPGNTQTQQAPAATAPTTNSGSGGGSSGGGSSGGGSTGCASGQVGTPPNCYPAPPAPLASGKQWKMIFNEEFGGTDYDHNKLTPCFDWNFGDCTNTFNNGREHYDPSQVRVSGGTAKLVAEPHSPPYSDGACQNSSCTYYSGLLSTARPNAGNGSDYLFSFTYGYVEASLKQPATQGFFTAFWMLPTDTSYNYDTEIDILENLGYDSQTMFMTYHYNNRSTSYTPNSGVGDNGSCPANDLSGAFHRFAVDWEPTHVAWYIDGVKCGQFSGNSSTIEDGPMQIILDLMVDNNWQRSWGVGLADDTLVRQLEVDYLRVYQQQ